MQFVHLYSVITFCIYAIFTPVFCDHFLCLCYFYTCILLSLSVSMLFLHLYSVITFCIYAIFKRVFCDQFLYLCCFYTCFLLSLSVPMLTFKYVLVYFTSLHLGIVHPLYDVALHQCPPLSSVQCCPASGGPLLYCVILPPSAWSSC